MNLQTLPNSLFPTERFTLLEHTQSQGEKRATPAFKFLDQSTGKSFWLEVKTCFHDWTNYIHWCTEVQLRKYLSCHKKTPTFLLLGVQDNANPSHSVYLLSMTQARHTYLLDACISHFQVSTNQPLTSAELWKR
ncbi:MAG: hypothetical protein JNK79_08015 [Chitinophagaceae bacterium]|nr:hypothetical protein [Chitinophagaceae bacterium]